MTQCITNLNNIPTDVASVIARHLSVKDTISLSNVDKSLSNSIFNIEEVKNRVANDILNNAKALIEPINEAYRRVTIFEKSLSFPEKALVKNIEKKLRACLNIENPRDISDAKFHDFIVTTSQIEKMIDQIPLDKLTTEKIEIKQNDAIAAFKEYLSAKQAYHIRQNLPRSVEKNLSQMQQRLQELRGPTGFDGLIHQAFKKMQIMQDPTSQEEFERLSNELKEIAVFDNGGNIIDGKIYQLEKRLKELQGISHHDLVNRAFQRMQASELKQDYEMRAFAHTLGVLGPHFPIKAACELIKLYAAFNQDPAILSLLSKFQEWEEQKNNIGSLVKKLESLLLKYNEFNGDKNKTIMQLEKIVTALTQEGGCVEEVLQECGNKIDLP